MKHTSLLRKTGQILTLGLLTLLGGAEMGSAQIPLQEFKAGRYRGTIFVTTSIADTGETTAALKVRERSTGTSTLKMIGTPQPALAIFGCGDDLVFKVFDIHNDISLGMVFGELNNSDANGSTTSRALQSLTVKGNSVNADLTYEQTLGITDINFTVRIRLTRVGGP
jgi:hypothetical protein